MNKMEIHISGKVSSFEYNKIPRFSQELLKTGENIKAINNETVLGSGDLDTALSKSFLSIERLGNYLYKVSYDNIVPFDPSVTPAIASCSAYVKDGKLYRNLDYNYDDTAVFWAKCKTFEGLGFIPGLKDGALDRDKIAQIPYHLYDGRNDNGIRISAHLLCNDWGYAGSGDRSVPLYLIPYLALTVLESATSVEEVTNKLSEFLDNIVVPETLRQNGYLFHFLLTDGTNTFAIEPPTESSGPYVVIKADNGITKLTNFRYVNAETLSGYSDERLQDHPTGVERWNEITDLDNLSDLRFTKAYESFTRPSEFIGINETSKSSTEAELEEVYNLASAEYANRKRDGKTWHTMYSVVYDQYRILELHLQENFIKDYS